MEKLLPVITLVDKEEQEVCPHLTMDFALNAKDHPGGSCYISGSQSPCLNSRVSKRTARGLLCPTIYLADALSRRHPAKLDYLSFPSMPLFLVVQKSSVPPPPDPSIASFFQSHDRNHFFHVLFPNLSARFSPLKPQSTFLKLFMAIHSFSKCLLNTHHMPYIYLFIYLSYPLP